MGSFMKELSSLMRPTRQAALKETLAMLELIYPTPDKVYTIYRIPQPLALNARRVAEGSSPRLPNTIEAVSIEPRVAPKSAPRL